jgi:hypothetical protein
VTAFSVAAYGSRIVMTIDRKKYGPHHAHLQMARTRGQHHGLKQSQGSGEVVDPVAKLPVAVSVEPLTAGSPAIAADG